MKKLLSLVVFVSLYSIGVSAQIEGYYRLRNGSGVEGKAYLNVQNGKLEPTMTEDDVVSAASSVFYLKTGPNLGGSSTLAQLLNPAHYQVLDFTSQSIDCQKPFKDIKSVMQSKVLFNAYTFKTFWKAFMLALNVNEDVKKVIDEFNETYDINPDEFTLDKYREWVETFDPNLYIEKERLGQNYKLYINFPDLPETFNKGTSQVALNAALLIIGPEIKESVKNAIGTVLTEDNAPGLYMILDVLERIQFGEKLYLIEDSERPKFSFARGGNIIEEILPGSITWAGKSGLWSLESLNDKKGKYIFTLKVDEKNKTAKGTYLTTFYSEFPYQLKDDMKAYVINNIKITGTLLYRKGYTTPKLIAQQGDIVPAKTPVLIEVSSIDQTKIVPIISDAKYEGGNMLSGTLYKKAITSLDRVLGTEKKAPAFITSGLISFIPDNTAYIHFGPLSPLANTVFIENLPDSAPNNAREFALDDEEDMPTGITIVNEDAKDTGKAVIYDLNGKQVTNPGKGIYIVNGKKTFIK